MVYGLIAIISKKSRAIKIVFLWGVFHVLALYFDYVQLDERIGFFGLKLLRR